jgi:hypothetical protein
MTSSDLNFVQIRICKGGRSPRNRALYAETQNGPLSKLMNIAELQQVGHVRIGNHLLPHRSLDPVHADDGRAVRMNRLTPEDSGRLNCESA